jgi:hypothetical protein
MILIHGHIVYIFDYRKTNGISPNKGRRTTEKAAKTIPLSVAAAEAAIAALATY